MYEAGRLANVFGDIGEEGDHVVACLLLDFVDPRDFECPSLADGLYRVLRDDTQIGLSFTARTSISSQIWNRVSGSQMVVNSGLE